MKNFYKFNFNRYLKGLAVYIFTCLTVSCIGQNLVPNPSFESYGILPCGWIMSSNGFEEAINDWVMPTDGTTDIFSTLVNESCYASTNSTLATNNINPPGYQNPRTGDVMSSIWTWGDGDVADYREYLEVKLIEPLEVGEIYYAEVYISFGENSKYATNNVGMYFSDTLVKKEWYNLNLEFTPQIIEDNIITDSLNWVKISGTFIATSPHEYLIMGNFSTDDSTDNIYFPNHIKEGCRYFVDDVYLSKGCFPVTADSTICKGTSIRLEATTNDPVNWIIATSPDEILSTSHTFIVTPDSTTQYIVYNYCDTIFVTVHVAESPELDLGPDLKLCFDEFVDLQANVDNASYLWQDNSKEPYFTVLEDGSYWVNITTAQGCQATDSILIQFDSPLTIDLGPDELLCDGTQKKLVVNQATAETDFIWSTGSTDVELELSKEGTYWLLAENGCGLFSDTMQLAYGLCNNCDFYIPNAFSPNYDGINDIFQPHPSCSVLEYELLVFNRWGAQIYETKNLQTGWDGSYQNEPTQTGVYTYFIKGVFLNRETFLIQGNLTLLR